MNPKSAAFTSTDHGTNSASHDELSEAMQNYLEQLERGEQPDRERLLKAHPHLSAELNENLDKLEALHQAAVELGQDVLTGVSASAPIPTEIGEYRIVRELGRGGMGIVYEAEQVSLDRRVALKILPFASIFDDRRLSRFQAEARAAASLEHPNIVKVFGVGCAGGVHFYAMQLIDGCTLADAIDKLKSFEKESSDGGTRSGEIVSSPRTDTAPANTLSTQRSTDRIEFFRSIANVGVQTANALHYAHQTGVIHRDIKPSNLLLNQDGQVWVADFGLARIEDETHTITGDVLGTLHYMSPEQSRGDGKVDLRTDIYSLGATLYELVTLYKPVDGQNRNALLRNLQDHPTTRPRHHDQRVPADLENVILKAMSKEPADRYNSASELATDLQRFLDHEIVHARRPSPLERTSRWVQRNPSLTALTLSIFILLLGGLIGATATAFRFKELANQRAMAIYARDFMLGQQAANEGRWNDVETLLMKQVPEDGQPDHRGFEYFHLWQRKNAAAPEHSIKMPLGCYSVAFHPTESRLAVGWFGRTVPIWDVSGAESKVQEEISSMTMENTLRQIHVQWSTDHGWKGRDGLDLA